MAEETSFSTFGQWSTLTGLNNTTMVIIFISTFIAIYLNTRRRAGVPPGPPLWPIVGNLLSLATKDTLATLAQLRKRYGDVYGLYIGTELTIFLNGYDVIHDALVKNGTLFSRRPVTKHSKLMLKNVSIVFGNGEAWKERRSFVLSSLNEICFKSNGSLIEGILHEELSYFIDNIESLEGPINLEGHVNMSFANVMYSVIHGKRSEYNDPGLRWYLDVLDRAFKRFARQQLIGNCFPFILKLPVDILQIRNVNEVDKLVKEYFSTTIAEAMQGYEGGRVNSLVDRYYSFTDNADENNADTNSKYLDMDSMWVMLSDLMAAGSETSATTIRWILLHLMLNPKLQNKLFNEINNVTGADRCPSIADRGDMPWVQATILEGFRIGSAVPLAVPHAVPRDVVFRGHLIPKDVTVLANTTSVLMDPELFPEPETFKPERFLSSDFSEVIVPKEFIPFSLGPRSCPGESLARLELFLYLTTLVQRFEFKSPPNDGLPSTKGVFGLTHKPYPFKIVFHKRPGIKP